MEHSLLFMNITGTDCCRPVSWVRNISGLIFKWNPWHIWLKIVGTSSHLIFWTRAGIILCMRPANEWRRYNVTSSLIGWAHSQNGACKSQYHTCVKTGIKCNIYVLNIWLWIGWAITYSFLNKQHLNCLGTKIGDVMLSEESNHQILCEPTLSSYVKNTFCNKVQIQKFIVITW